MNDKFEARNREYCVIRLVLGEVHRNHRPIEIADALHIGNKNHDRNRRNFRQRITPEFSWGLWYDGPVRR